MRSGLIRLTWLVGLLIAVGCSDKSAVVSSSGEEEASEPGAPPQKGFAYPQEELARMSDAPKITGTITVEKYTQGMLQIDVTLPVDGETDTTRGVPPITVFRQNAPGPYELYLPPGTKAVNLALILDIKGNGPDAEDPKLVYEKNPVEITGPVVSGVDMVIDSTAAALPPPSDEGADSDTGERSDRQEPSDATSGGVDALSAVPGVGESEQGGDVRKPVADSPEARAASPGGSRPAQESGHSGDVSGEGEEEPKGGTGADSDEGATGRDAPVAAEAGRESGDAQSKTGLEGAPTREEGPAPEPGSGGDGPGGHPATPDPLDESLDTVPE